MRRKPDGSQSEAEISYGATMGYKVSSRPISYLTPYGRSAAAGHWKVEAMHAMHYQRDVTLQKDSSRCSNNTLIRTMSDLRSLVYNLLKRTIAKSMAAKIDQFAYDFNSLI